MEFGYIKNRKVNMNFNRGHITSDEGMLLLRKVDNKIELTKEISQVMKDSRIKKKCKHSLDSMLNSTTILTRQACLFSIFSFCVSNEPVPKPQKTDFPKLFY